MGSSLRGTSRRYMSLDINMRALNHNLRNALCDIMHSAPILILTSLLLFSFIFPMASSAQQSSAYVPTAGKITYSMARQLFKTGFEDISSVPRSTSAWYVTNYGADAQVGSVPFNFEWSESSPTYNHGWIEPTQENDGVTPYAGSRCMGLQTTQNMRIELNLYPTALSSIGFSKTPPIQFYCSEWWYFPSGWKIYSSDSDWYSIFCLYDFSSNGQPQSGVHIVDSVHTGANGAPVNFELSYRDSGIYLADVGRYNNYALPRGQWLHFEYFTIMTSSTTYVQTWLDGTLLWDVMIPYPMITHGNGFAINMGKVYHQSSSNMYEYWLDDVELWDDIPSGA